MESAAVGKRPDKQKQPAGVGDQQHPDRLGEKRAAGRQVLKCERSQRKARQARRNEQRGPDYGVQHVNPVSPFAADTTGYESRPSTMPVKSLRNFSGLNSLLRATAAAARRFRRLACLINLQEIFRS